jgi:hypothetical protein
MDLIFSQTPYPFTLYDTSPIQHKSLINETNKKQEILFASSFYIINLFAPVYAFNTDQEIDDKAIAISGNKTLKRMIEMSWILDDQVLYKKLIKHYLKFHNNHYFPNNEISKIIKQNIHRLDPSQTSFHHKIETKFNLLNSSRA